MKLGLSTWSLLGLDVYEAVKAIGDARCEYVELWGEVPHAYPGWVDKKRLRDALSSYDMAVTAHAPFTDLNVASPFQPVKAAVEKTLERFIEFAAFLGVRMVTVHPGSVHNELMVPQSAASAISTIKKLVKAAGGRLSVNVENQARSSSKYRYPLAATEESLQHILDETKGLKLTLDTGHAHAGGQNPSLWAEGVMTRLREVHLNDNSGTSDDHLIPGRGTAGLNSFLGRASGKDPLVCLELNPHIYTREEVLASLDDVRAMIAEAA